MNAVVRDMPPSWVEERRAKGIDLFDEMWDGVLHVNPVPGNPHQDLRDELFDALSDMAKSRPGRWCTARNIAKPGRWPQDYRVSDMSFLARREGLTGPCLFGPPRIVVEIAEPGDDSRAKLPWYAELGAPEVWMIEADTRLPEILLLSGRQYLKQRPGPGNWFRSEGFPVELRAGRAGKRKVLEVRAPGETKARARL